MDDLTKQPMSMLPATTAEAAAKGSGIGGSDLSKMILCRTCGPGYRGYNGHTSSVNTIENNQCQMFLEE